jgi:hypothetical protein
MQMSQGVKENARVEDILLENIPGALSVVQAHEKNDRNGTDWWVEMPGNHHLSVDAKVREEDWWATHPDDDDLALELWSVIGEQLHDGTRTRQPQIVGWTLNEDKRSDYILWLWKDTGRWCLVPFHMLCKVFQLHRDAWCKQYKRSEQFTPRPNSTAVGYFSECVFVDRREVWAAIYKQFAGSLHVTPPQSRDNKVTDSPATAVEQKYFAY